MHSAIRLLLLAGALGAAAVLTGPASRAEADRHEAEAAARTILSAIQDRLVARGAVQPHLLEEVTTTCQGERVYCKKVDLGDEAGTHMQIRVDLSKPWETTGDMPVPKRWEGVPTRRDAQVDALIRTRTVDTRQGKRIVVDVRAARQRVYLYQATSQLAAGRTVQASVKFAQRRFRQLVAAAQANGLIGEALPRVVARSGDVADKELIDGDVVYVTVAAEGPIRTRFDVFARPSSVPDGEAHDIHVDLPGLTPAQRGGVSIRPRAERTATGFRIRSTSTGDVPVILTVARPLFDELRRGRFTTRLGTVIPVVFRGGGGSRRVYLHLTTWTIAVTRFELRATADSKLRNLREEVAERFGDRAVGVGPFLQFNEHREALGNLRDAWEDLRPRVTPGRPENPERILVAWGRNLETGEDIVKGVHKEDDPLAGAKVAGDRLRPAFEVLVLREAKFVPRAATEDDDGLDGFGGDEPFDESRMDGPAHDLDDTIRETWEDFYLDTLDVTVHALDALRGTSEDQPIQGGTVADLDAWDGEWRDELERRAIARWVGLGYATAREPLAPFQVRRPGLFEVRLSLTIARRDDREDRRQAAVALRFHAVQSGMDVHVLEFETRRGRE